MYFTNFCNRETKKMDPYGIEEQNIWNEWNLFYHVQVDQS